MVEDHGLTRAGLRAMLDSSRDVRVIGEAGDGISAENVILATRPDVAVIDIGLPGRNGIALTRALSQSAPETKVLILSMSDSDDEVLAALWAGADGYCVKTSDSATVLDAVRVVASGGAYFDARIAHVVLRRLGGPVRNPDAKSPLTPRELDVLRLIAEGVGNAEICERLNISLGTVKARIRDILDKLQAADRTQAAIYGVRRGLL